MAISKTKSTAKTAANEKLTVAKRLGTVHLTSVTLKKNIKGTEYIPTPYGAVYANLDKVTVGLHTAVELSNGAIALNTITPDEKLGFLNEKKEKYPNLSMADIREMFGIE